MPKIKQVSGVKHINKQIYLFFYKFRDLMGYRNFKEEIYPFFKEFMEKHKKHDFLDLKIGEILKK